VGDRADTDLVGARALGWGTALVLTGVTELATLLDLPAAPDHLLADVGGLLAPPGPAIRPATAADASAVAGLLGEAPDGGEGSLLLVAHGGVEAVGPVGVVACRRSGDRARLDGLAVEPRSRGRLVGTRLLLAACIELHGAGARLVTADAAAAGGTARAGWRFLERLGFVRDATGTTLARDLA